VKGRRAEQGESKCHDESLFKLGLVHHLTVLFYLFTRVCLHLCFTIWQPRSNHLCNNQHKNEAEMIARKRAGHNQRPRSCNKWLMDHTSMTPPHAHVDALPPLMANCLSG
jgi:hypothetical protein